MATAKRLGLVGAGSLAHEVTRGLEGGALPGWELAGVLAPPEFPHDYPAELSCHTPGELLDKRPDLVVEVASAEAVADVVPPLLEAGVDVVILSVASFRDAALRKSVEAAASAPGAGQAVVSSGAIAGLDALRAAAGSGQLERVHLQTTKRAVAGHVAGAERELLFEGNAGDAAERYPRNLNVAAAIALAGLGFERTEVSIWLDPAQERLRHHLTIEGGFGRIETTCENLPSPRNPQSSWLAALSALDAIRRRDARLLVGG